MNKSKSLGQVFTPEYIVDMILDAIEYKGGAILDKYILEPSFGDGAILIKVVQRYIEACKVKKLENKQIANMLNEHIYGIEIDGELVVKTKERLSMLLGIYGIPNIEWEHLYSMNTLHYIEKTDFSFIVGNPPYIRIHNLDDKTKSLIKDFIFSVGTTDMYILFFEKCLNLLSKKGKLCFITPNSYMKNTSQAIFREYLLKNNLIEKIIDFKSSNIFEDFSVYAAITLLNKTKNTYDFTYSEYEQEKCLYLTKISSLDFDKKTFREPWTFNTEENNNLIEAIKNRSFTLDKFCTIQYGVATNRDAIYIGKTDPIKGDKKHILFKNTKIEKGILKPVVKGSTYNGTDTESMIIFPYIWDANKKIYTVIPEEELKDKYPLAYQYLSDNKTELEQRDMDDNAAWYQFGRSQGLTNSKYKKLVIKNVIDSEKTKMEVYELPEETVVYSGIYITTQNIALLPKIKSILESKEFCKYCNLVGKDMSGGWKNINSKIIKNYGVNQFLANELFYLPDGFVELSNEEKDAYWDKYYKDLFLEKITESYMEYLVSSRSTSKIKPIHSFIAEAIQYKLGDTYVVKADGFNLTGDTSEVKEQKVEGKYYDKNVDISVSKNGIVLGSIGVKFICGNYSQNANNYFENMLGETVNLRSNNQPYSQLIILPEFVPYYNQKSVCTKLEYIQAHHIEKYAKLNEENVGTYHRPDIMSIFLINTGNEELLLSLKEEGTAVNKLSAEFKTAINISYSDIENNKQLNTKTKCFLLKHNDINKFLDAFVSLIIANSYGK